jgi:perosamine synthetase
MKRLLSGCGHWVSDSTVHLQPFYRQRFGFREGDFSVTERVARSTLALPFYGNLSEDQVAFVCEALSQVLASQKHSP